MKQSDRILERQKYRIFLGTKILISFLIGCSMWAKSLDYLMGKQKHNCS